MEQLSRRNFVLGVASAAATASAALHANAYGAEAPAAPQEWDMEADVVCVGSGAGGSSSAYWSLKGGLSAIVLESMELPGGGSALNAGEICLSGGTALQKELGYEDTPENFKAFLTAFGNIGVKEELLDVFVNAGPAVYDWLVDIGVDFPKKGTHLNVYYRDPKVDGYYGLMSQGSEFHPWFTDIWNPVPTCHMASTYAMVDPEETDQYFDASSSRDHGHDGTGFMLPIIHAVKDLGGEYLCSTRGTHLYKDETGRVVGVQAEGPDGETINIKANKAVVLAGGDWSSDLELRKRFAPKFADIPGVSVAVAGNDGTSLRMGLEAGGICVNGDSMWCAPAGTGFGAWGLQQCDETDGQFPGGKSIIVDENGTRFICEDLYQSYVGQKTAEVRVDRPVTGRVWNIMDQKTMEGQHAVVEEMGFGYLIHPDECIYADTYEELAEKIEAPCLVDTIEFYNRYAAEGKDPRFNRRPGNLAVIEEPLVATRLDTSWQMYSQGGLDIDACGHVLAFDGSQIPGLYAAGRNARGLGEGYFTQVTGMSCSAGLIMGMQIGLHLTDEK